MESLKTFFYLLLAIICAGTMSSARPMPDSSRTLLDAKQVSQSSQTSTGSTISSSSTSASVVVNSGGVTVKGETSTSTNGGTQANTASVTAGYILIDGKYYYANTAAGRAEAQGNGVATTNKVAGTNIAENGGLKAGSLHEVSAQGTLSSSQGNNVVVLTTKQPNV